MPYIIKPACVANSDNDVRQAIYSIDIHPDGERFATGGAGESTGCIKIWSFTAVRQITAEGKAPAESHPLLCRLESHTSSVNCVRWSNSGKYLASASDDMLVMIWQYVGRTSQPQSFGGRQGNIEHWRCTGTLRGHSMDVLHVAWHPADKYIASCSVDNSIIIWNAQKFPDIITTLRGHEGLVKGVSWDPIGKYLCSQSDDKTVRIWATSNWTLIKTISEPFTEATSSTLLLRLDWSPDGSMIATAHAVNNGGPVSKIITRKDWDDSLDFAGHRKAVTCVRWNRCIFSHSAEKKAQDKTQLLVALGSKDKSISIWSSNLRRPFVVFENVFNNTVTDLSWASEGYELLASSMDGTVMYVRFDSDELGFALSPSEKNSLLLKQYPKIPTLNGFIFADDSALHTGAADADSEKEIIENPDILKARQLLTQIKSPVLTGTTAALDFKKQTLIYQGSPCNGHVPNMNGSSSGEVPNGICNGTGALNGNSSIVVSSVTTNGCDGFATAKVSSLDSASSMCSSSVQQSERQSSISKQIETKTKDGRRRIVPVFLGSAYTDVSLSSMDANSSCSEAPSTLNLSSNDSSCSVSSFLSDSSSKPTSLKAQLAAETVNAHHARPVVAVSTVDASLSAGTKPPVSSTLSSTPVTALPVKKRELEQSDTMESSKRSRLLSDRLPTSGVAVASQNTSVETNCASTSAPVLRSYLLPVPQRLKTLSIQVPSTSGLCVVESQNDVPVGNALRAARIRCTSDGNIKWQSLLPSAVLNLAASRYIVAAASEDSGISVLSMTSGASILCGLILEAPVAALDCSCWFLLAVDVHWRVSTWDIKKRQTIMHNTSSMHLSKGSSDETLTMCKITESGAALIGFSSGRVFSYTQGLNAWVVVVNAEDPRFVGSGINMQSFSQTEKLSGPLRVLLEQARHKASDSVRSRHVATSTDSHDMRKLCTTAFLEQQLQSSFVIRSCKEYRYWLQQYVSHLSSSGYVVRLKELLDDLLQPRYANSDCSTEIMGIPKLAFLKEVLPLLASSTDSKVQRLFTEFNDELVQCDTSL